MYFLSLGIFMSVCVYKNAYRLPWRPETNIWSLGVGFYVTASWLTRRLGTKFRSSARTASILNCGAQSPLLSTILFLKLFIKMVKGNSQIPLNLSPVDGRQFLWFWFPWHMDHMWVWRERFILILSQVLTHIHRTYINKEFIKWRHKSWDTTVVQGTSTSWCLTAWNWQQDDTMLLRVRMWFPCLAAESILQRHPWNLWFLQGGMLANQIVLCCGFGRTTG